MNYLLEETKLWWSKDIKDSDRHEVVTDLVNRLISDQPHLREDNLEHLKLYIKRGYSMDQDGNLKMAGADARIGINAVKSAIDTVCARITAQKPRPMFTTEGGRWDMKRKAKKLQKFIDGVFHEEKYYHHARRAFKDCAIYGTGFLKFYHEKGKIRIERVYPGEVLVDEQSAMTCEPNSMFQVKQLPLESLCAKFPKHKDVIIEKANLRHNSVSAAGVITTMVRVVECWHKPQSGKEGMHCITVDGATLLCEDYKHDFFPIVPIRWNELPVGFYGNGAAEDLHGLQEEIDYLMHRIQKSMHINATAWLLKHASDKTPNSHFTNKIGTIIEWSGDQPPELRVQPALHQQVFDHVKWLHELVFDDTGVSQMSATSRKPKGVESGIALQTLLDVESQRFQLVLESWEEMAVEASRVIIALAKQHFKGGKSDYKVKFDGGRFAETITWSEVNISADEYILKRWPTNLLPSQPAGRIEYVERMIQSGLLDTQTGFMLLDFPDVEDYQSLALAALKNVLWIIDQVIYEDNYIKPKAWYDLNLGMRHMQMAMARAEIEGCPEETLEEGLRWVAEANDILNPPQMQAPMDQASEEEQLAAEEEAIAQMEAEAGMAPGGGEFDLQSTGVDISGAPPAANPGGPAANLGNIAPAGTIVPGTE